LKKTISEENTTTTGPTRKSGKIVLGRWLAKESGWQK